MSNRAATRRDITFIFCWLMFAAGCSSVSSKSNARFLGGRWDSDGDEKDIPIYGYIDKTGKFAIKPQFRDAGPFSEGLACVGNGYIDHVSNRLVTPELRACGRFSEGLAPVQLASYSWGYLDKTGKFAIDPQFQDAHMFSEGLAAVVVDHKLGYIDKSGKMRINPQYDPEFSSVWPLRVSASSEFADGLAEVRVGCLTLGNRSCEGGKMVIAPQWESAEPFSEGLAMVSNDKAGYIDRTGTIVIPLQYKRAGSFSNGLAEACIGDDNPQCVSISPQFGRAAPFFSSGIAMVMEGFPRRFQGYIDKSGSSCSRRRTTSGVPASNDSVLSA